MERDRLRHVEALRAAALGAVDAVAGDADGGADGAGAALGAAARGLDALEGVDGELDGLAVRWRSLVVEAEDLAAELRGYAEGLDAEPGRLDVVEERLAVLDRLARKHGGTVAAVLAHAATCRARRDELLGAEEALEKATSGIERARAELDRLAVELRTARLKAAPRLATEVRRRLEALAMEGAAFEIELTEREAGPTGADAVEFLIAPNAGVPAAPLRETASGGELSRVMLAIMAARAEAGGGTNRRPPARTLVFDEVDAGIGGQTARAVGEQLRALAERGQVVCITHLPQVASLAARHFSIAKDPVRGAGSHHGRRAVRPRGGRGARAHARRGRARRRRPPPRGRAAPCGLRPPKRLASSALRRYLPSQSAPASLTETPHA